MAIPCFLRPPSSNAQSITIACSRPSLYASQLARSLWYCFRLPSGLGPASVNLHCVDSDWTRTSASAHTQLKPHAGGSPHADRRVFMGAGNTSLDHAHPSHISRCPFTQPCPRLFAVPDATARGAQTTSWAGICTHLPLSAALSRARPADMIAARI
jgi:hypothetical protein